MRVAVVGAGLAGLLAGGTLARAGHDVVLLDKGRSPGGRLATRRVGGAVIDHGAQFFTVRTPNFAALTHGWEGDGVVRAWCHGFGATADGHPRYVAVGGMNALAKHLARGLEVRTRSMVFGVRPGAGAAWSVGLDDGTAVEADAVVVTCPLPQSYSLLIGAQIELPEALRGTDYHRTLALLTVLDGPAPVPAPGGVQMPDDVFSWIGDNVARGASTVPAVTFHASPEWSSQHWDDAPGDLHEALRREAGRWLGRAAVVESQVKRWRFATPVRSWPEPCWRAPDPAPPLVLAGDAFAGGLVPSPGIEAAALSGLAAAAAVKS